MTPPAVMSPPNLENVTAVPVAGEAHDPYVLMVWAASCSSLTVVVFLLSTALYIKKVMDSPRMKRRLKKRRELARKVREDRYLADVSREAIPVGEFLKESKTRLKKGKLSWEFQALNRQVIDNSCAVAQKAQNALRNASPDVLPYDHCRVLLEADPADRAANNYINASYIDSSQKPKAYIATQGPKRETVGDFWQMVWQENCRCIVMVTNLFEHARLQCEKYWHNQHGKYGKIHVWLESTEILAEFHIRTFKVCKPGEQEERTVKQFQFASWAEDQNPKPSALLEFRRRIRAFLRHKPGPIVVHCSTGAGRTGVFIAIDALLEKMAIDKSIDIFNCIYYLRNCRQKMVKTREQYEFLYETIAVFLQCGVTVISAQDLPQMVQKLSVRHAECKSTGFEHEFRALQVVVKKPTVGECAGGHRAENRRKSRDIMVQPPERARPYLITQDNTDESTDYINAVYVDGYRHTNAYVVTQWPVKSTVNDVWRLIYDYHIPTMVLLDDVTLSRNYPEFWPRSTQVENTFGPLTVVMKQEDGDDNFVTRLFTVKKFNRYVGLREEVLRYLYEIGTLCDFPNKKFYDGEIEADFNEDVENPSQSSASVLSSPPEEAERTIRMFQLRCWPNKKKVPSSSSALVKLLTRVEDWQLNCCNGRIPTLVMSKNGFTRCGVFCAVSMTWDKLKSEGEVDIFRTVQIIKTNRTQLVENMAEYMYCYTFVALLVQILASTHPFMIPVNDLLSGLSEGKAGAGRGHQGPPLQYQANGGTTTPSGQKEREDNNTVVAATGNTSESKYKPVDSEANEQDMSPVCSAEVEIRASALIPAPPSGRRCHKPEVIMADSILWPTGMMRHRSGSWNSTEDSDLESYYSAMSTLDAISTGAFLQTRGFPAPPVQAYQVHTHGVSTVKSEWQRLDRSGNLLDITAAAVGRDMNPWTELRPGRGQGERFRYGLHVKRAQDIPNVGAHGNNNLEKKPLVKPPSPIPQPTGHSDDDNAEDVEASVRFIEVDSGEDKAPNGSKSLPFQSYI